MGVVVGCMESGEGAWGLEEELIERLEEEVGALDGFSIIRVRFVAFSLHESFRVIFVILVIFMILVVLESV